MCFCREQCSPRVNVGKPWHLNKDNSFGSVKNPTLQIFSRTLRAKTAHISSVKCLLGWIISCADNVWSPRLSHRSARLLPSDYSSVTSSSPEEYGSQRASPGPIAVHWVRHSPHIPVTGLSLHTCPLHLFPHQPIACSSLVFLNSHVLRDHLLSRPSLPSTQLTAILKLLGELDRWFSRKASHPRAELLEVNCVASSAASLWSKVQPEVSVIRFSAFGLTSLEEPTVPSHRTSLIPFF